MLNAECRMPGKLAAVCLIFLLAGCGFHPVYGSHDNGDKPEVAAQMNNVAIDNIADRHGQILRNNLIDRMYGQGRPQNPQYHLSVNIKATEEGLGILENAVSTLTELTLTATYTLTDANGKELMKGTAHSVSSFNQISAQYSTMAAEQDAYQRTIDEVSEQIVNRLGLYFSEGPTKDEIKTTK
jgi:LPS-assembly lipoprotein